MISHLSGKVDSTSPGTVVLEVGGVGFLVRVPETLSESLRPGEQQRLATQLVLRQDEICLYGFATSYDRELFQLLTSISGVGPKLALRILGGLRPGELAEAILSEDLKALTGLPGVGLKTAKRIVVELSEKIANLAPAPGSGVEREAQQVLCSLGCSYEEAQEAVSLALAGMGDNPPVDRLVMEAMRVLGQHAARA